MALVQARFFFFDLISAASCRAASVATRLEDPVGDILHANGFRYEIENLFRVTKSEFDSRPVYLRLEDRIRSHFAICFVALLLFPYRMIYIASCSIRDRKNGLRFRCRRIRSTELPKSSSRNIFRPSTRLILAGISTQISTSLSGLLSPLATEPNIHKVLTPKFLHI